MWIDKQLSTLLFKQIQQGKGVTVTQVHKWFAQWWRWQYSLWFGTLPSTSAVITVSVSQVDRALWPVCISVSLQPLLQIFCSVWNTSPLIYSLGAMWIFFFYFNFLFFILVLSSFPQNSVSKFHFGATNHYSNLVLLCLTWHCTNSCCHWGQC